jgi:hypothetical protein
MDLDRGRPLFASHAASGKQFQSHGAVELRWPTDGQFQAFSRQQVPVGGKQDAVAAHVERLANANLIRALAVEDLKADFPLDGEPVRASAIVFFFFQSQSVLLACIPRLP